MDKGELRKILQSARRERLEEIRKELVSLDSHRHLLIEERGILRRAEHKEIYNCPCVRLNADMGIHNSLDLEANNRRGFMTEMTIALSLSCDKGCPRCKGSGISQ